MPIVHERLQPLYTPVPHHRACNLNEGLLGFFTGGAVYYSPIYRVVQWPQSPQPYPVPPVAATLEAVAQTIINKASRATPTREHQAKHQARRAHRSPHGHEHQVALVSDPHHPRTHLSLRSASQNHPPHQNLTKTHTRHMTESPSRLRCEGASRCS